MIKVPIAALYKDALFNKPDRFVNGDPSNDSIAGMQEAANLSFKGGRHGSRCYNSLDYLEDLGALNFGTPVLENDMPSYSYHGYAITDFTKLIRV